MNVGGPERLAGEAQVRGHRAVIAKRQAVGRGELHPEVVRMLTVDQRRLTVRGLAGLQQQRVSSISDGGRVEREHAAQAESPAPRGPVCDDHPHRGRVELGVAAVASLVVVYRVGGAMDHQIQEPLVKWYPNIGVDSGCQLVPEDLRLIGYGPKKPVIWWPPCPALVGGDGPGAERRP